MLVPPMEELKQVSRLVGDKYRDATMPCLEMLEGETGEVVRDENGVLLGSTTSPKYWTNSKLLCFENRVRAD
jgi:hypothetical protein